MLAALCALSFVAGCILVGIVYNFLKEAERQLDAFDDNEY